MVRPGLNLQREIDMRLVQQTLLCMASALVGVSSAAHAELVLPRDSPPARLAQQVGLTDIAVDYVSPAVKGRKIRAASFRTDNPGPSAVIRRRKSDSAGK